MRMCIFLKRYLPYHECDHVLNIVVNTLTGATCLMTLNCGANDETFMDGLESSASRTDHSRDFTRRFCEEEWWS